MATSGGEVRNSTRRSQYKATIRSDEMVSRRREALMGQQCDARANRIADVRRIAMEALLGSEDTNDLEEEVQVEDDDDDGMDVDRAGKGNKMRRLRTLNRTLFFARQFQMPDWLLDAPPDLGTNWLLQVRPEGDRCLLLSDGGRVQVRRKNGYVLEVYQDSRFPRGLTILDVVCLEAPQEPMDTSMKQAVLPEQPPQHEDGPEPSKLPVDQEQSAGDVDMGGGAGGRGHRGSKGGRGGKGRGRGGRGYGGDDGSAPHPQRRPARIFKYAVCDVLAWGDQDMVGADAECRMFWLESRFSEMSDKPSRKARALQLVPAVPVTPELLSEAYHLDSGYPKDSLLFLHKEGHYHVSEAVTPLALLWRDRHVSKWVVDTQDPTGEKLPERQAIVLELRVGGRLRTAERRIVAQLTEQDLEALQSGSLNEKSGQPGAAARPRSTGTLVRVEADGVDLAQRCVSVAKVSGFVPSRTRVWADTWSRVVFQHLHRSGQAQCISFQALMQTAVGRGQGAAIGEVK